MRYVAAYLLAALGGKDAPTVSDIERILSSVGIESDSEKVNLVVNQMKGKSVDDLVAKGKEKLASMPAGGGVAVAAAAGGGGAAAAPAAAAATAEKKEEKKQEKEESDQSDDDMGFGLFD